MQNSWIPTSFFPPTWDPEVREERERRALMKLAQMSPEEFAEMEDRKKRRTTKALWVFVILFFAVWPLWLFSGIAKLLFDI